MHLPFHYTSSDNWNMLWFIGGAALLLFGSLLANTLRRRTSENDTQRALILLGRALGVLSILAGVFIMCLAFLQSSNDRAKLEAQSDKVNHYNLQLLKHKVDERYDVGLTTKQAQKLLTNYVYGGNSPDLRNYHNVLVEVDGAQTKVKLVQQGQRWYLYSTSQELIPIR